MQPKNIVCLRCVGVDPSIIPFQKKVLDTKLFSEIRANYTTDDGQRPVTKYNPDEIAIKWIKNYLTNLNIVEIVFM